MNYGGREDYSNKKPYSELTDGERWEWHADDYAFRIVILGEPWEGLTSPCDPEHKWFARDLIEKAVERKRAKLHARQDWNRKAEIEAAQQAKWRRAAKLRAERAGLEYREPLPDLAAEGRRLCDEWAVKHGYLDFETAQRFGASYTDVAKSFGGIKRMPLRGPLAGAVGTEDAYDAALAAPIPDGEAEYLASKLKGHE